MWWRNLTVIENIHSFHILISLWCWTVIKKEISKIMKNSRKRIHSKRSEMHNWYFIVVCDVYIFYYKFENGFFDVKHFCCYYAIYHNWKVPGEYFLLLTSRTCHFIFHVELWSLWTVNNTIFCLFKFLYISYG